MGFTRKIKANEHRILLLAILIGAIFGALAGIILGDGILFISFLGTIFLNAIKMMILPVTISAMIVGITSVGDIRKFGRLGVTTVVYFLITSGIAVILGIVLVNILHPGSYMETTNATLLDRVASKEYSFLGVIAGMVSPNLIKSMLDLEMLPILFFSLFFGGILSTLGKTGEPVVRFFKGVFAASMAMIRIIIWFAPIGVFALIATKIAQEGGGEAFFGLLRSLGLYALTVVIGLAVHGFVILPVILKVVTGRSPVQYIKSVSEALLTAFSTASSSATLPVTMAAVEEQAGVDNKISGIVLPVGATINMDGTALYEAVAAIFIAQAYGVQLDIVQQVIIFLTATLAAIGAAGIPEAGLVTMVIVLKAVGLPLEGISMLLPIDWFLDRCRTAVNVFGDCVGAAVVEKLAPEYGFSGGKN